MTEFSSQTDMLRRAYGDVISDGDWRLQLAVLGLPKADYVNKRVLDIGSGRTNTLARGLVGFAENVQVIPVNPQLANDELCVERGIPKEQHTNGVAALAQGFLPFKDSSFDTVVSVLGVPNSLISSEIPSMFNEIWRVLKPGGIASLWPAGFKKERGVTALVEQPYVRTGALHEDLLSLLPEPYRDATHRVHIEKPDISPTDLPAEISYFEAEK